ncbi:hypothetical protein BDW74DRAFT_162744 [Aspergillus multicolor]|uniref:uncharacterized protein n=1 Tax=Aspergillus multicolor TaxID=41759 RepID=UPI003CCE18D3
MTMCFSTKRKCLLGFWMLLCTLIYAWHGWYFAHNACSHRAQLREGFFEPTNRMRFFTVAWYVQEGDVLSSSVII